MAHLTLRDAFEIYKGSKSIRIQRTRYESNAKSHEGLEDVQGSWCEVLDLLMHVENNMFEDLR